MTTIFSSRPLPAGTPSRRDFLLVLVVDDDAGGGEAKADDLRQAGMRVCTARTAEHAIDWCKRQRFDAVVIDHHPDDDYSEVVLANAPDGSPAVIVSTAATSDVTSLGARHVDKVFALRRDPVEPYALVEVVQEAIAASNMPRSP